MNNRFKFRVWDVVHKEYSYAPDRYYALRLDGGIVDGNGCSYDEHHIVQQYTGLKDKHNNDIYEGDIVQYNQNSSYDNMNFFVKWNSNELRFILQANSGEELVNEWTPNGNRFELLEVVGNIFENSDVLK